MLTTILFSNRALLVVVVAIRVTLSSVDTTQVKLDGMSEITKGAGEAIQRLLLCYCRHLGRLSNWTLLIHQTAQSLHNTPTLLQYSINSPDCNARITVQSSAC